MAKQFEAETGVHVDFQIIPSDQYCNVLETKLEAQENELQQVILAPQRTVHPNTALFKKCL